MDTITSQLEEKVKKLNLPDRNLLIGYNSRFYLYNRNMSCGMYKGLDKAFEAITVRRVGNGSGSFTYMDHRMLNSLVALVE